MNTKRKGIYKILIILTTIICLLNGCIRLFNTFADTVNEGSTIIIEDRMPEDFQRILKRNDISYIWFTRIINDTDSQTQYQTYYCPLDDDLEYSLSGDSFIFHDSGDSNAYHTFDGYHKKDGTWGHSNVNNSFSRITINEFTVNFSDKIVNDLNCEAIKLCINGHLYDPNALNVEVSFSPALSGSIDREIDLNGVSTFMDKFTMTVRNRGNIGVQYFMCICDVGYSPSSFYALDNFTTGGSATIDFNSSQCHFIYLSEETVYLNQGNAFKSLITSPWHYCASKSFVDKYFKWDMLDLEANKEYDVVVFAMPNNLGTVSTIASQVGGFVIPDDSHYADVMGKDTYSVDFSKVQEVYRSTFSVVNPATYNPDSSIYGAIANNHNTDYRREMSRIRGFIDDFGTFHSADYDTLSNGYGVMTSDGIKPYSQTNYGYNSYGSNNRGSYNTLVNETSNVFSFFNYVLTFFPSSTLLVYNLALWSFLIILVIRRLR